MGGPNLPGVLGTLRLAWDAFSGVAAIAGVAGVTLLVLAIAGLTVLPARWRRPALITGAGLVVAAALWQAGQAHGVHLEARHLARLAAEAEASRHALAEATTTQDLETARENAAAAAARAAGLQEELARYAKDPHRNDVCLPRADVRRLRGLR